MTKSHEVRNLPEVRDLRKPCWFRIDNEIVDKYGPSLSAYGIAVYAVISRHCKNCSHQSATLSQRDIARSSGLSQSRVAKSLGDLSRLGLIRVNSHGGISPGKISTITLLKVEATEHPKFSSPTDLSAAGSCNKEVKTNTETNTSPLPSLSDGVLEENACARASTYNQQDFDERDLRELHKARGKIEMKLRNGGLSGLSPDRIFSLQCAEAGLTVRRANDLLEQFEP